MSRTVVIGLLTAVVLVLWLRTPIMGTPNPGKVDETTGPAPLTPLLEKLRMVEKKSGGGGGGGTPPRWQNEAASSPAYAPQSFSQPSNIMVVVKTSTANDGYTKREGRVAGILKTWFPLALNNTWFVTDKSHAELFAATGGHLVSTPCPSGHSKPDLCCKLEHEFKLFHDQRYSKNGHANSGNNNVPPEWFCHIDDDMYLFPKNLEKMLANYNPADRHFIGPSNLFPDDTLHKTPEFPAGSTATGLHHPCNGAYCMSYTLVDLIYPKMKDGQFSSSCTKTPDDIAITDLAFSVGKTRLTVVNDFHHQHSKNYKLPFFDPPRLQSSAITMYGYDDLPSLHAVLYGNIFGSTKRKSHDHKTAKQIKADEKMLKAAADAAVATANGRLDVSKPWWDQIANLTVLPPKGKAHNLGFNFCRRSSPPPDVSFGGSVSGGGGGDGGRSTAAWCGPPVFSKPYTEESSTAAAEAARENELAGEGSKGAEDDADSSFLEPLCESRSTYKEMHPTHKHSEAALQRCPWTAASAPQSFGTPQQLDDDALRQIKIAHHPTSVDESNWASWQYSKGANPRVWQGLAKRLARLGKPGTCCIANPSVAPEDGGNCYWTAPDQGACLLQQQ